MLFSWVAHNFTSRIWIKCLLKFKWRKKLINVILHWRLLPFPLKNLYTYKISGREFKFIKNGFRVLVPFGGKRVFTAIVVCMHKKSIIMIQKKYLHFKYFPVVDKNQILFWKWMVIITSAQWVIFWKLLCLVLSQVKLY